jgi:hypothetical protein
LGLTSVVLLFGPIIALASAGEPPLEATGAEAAEYYGRLDATWPFRLSRCCRARCWRRTV